MDARGIEEGCDQVRHHYRAKEVIVASDRTAGAARCCSPVGWVVQRAVNGCANVTMRSFDVRQVTQKTDGKERPTLQWLAVRLFDTAEARLVVRQLRGVRMSL